MDRTPQQFAVYFQCHTTLMYVFLCTKHTHSRKYNININKGSPFTFQLLHTHAYLYFLQHTTMSGSVPFSTLFLSTTCTLCVISTVILYCIAQTHQFSYIFNLVPAPHWNASHMNGKHHHQFVFALCFFSTVRSCLCVCGWITRTLSHKTTTTTTTPNFRRTSSYKACIKQV